MTSSTEPDDWLIRKIADDDIVTRLAAVKLSLGLAWSRDYGNKVIAVISDAQREITRLRTELSELNDGKRVVLAKNREHALALLTVAEAGVKSFPT